MKPEQVRQRFIEFYESIGYLLLPKASMIDPSIPMSFVMSAGLIQVETSLSKLGQQPERQVVLVQDCFRHFDIDKVGTDNIHLSFFEMPGAFVFGSNEKAVAIQKMWRLATSILGIEKENIWITYFAGGTVLGYHLLEDIETKQAWLEVGLSPNRLIGLGPENNYWIQGKGVDGIKSRKCGPNTELFFDLGQDKGCSQICKPGCSCGRFIEFSNSLFICLEFSSEDNVLFPMKNPFTETVIGTERVSMILQKAQSVFETTECKSIFDFLDRYIVADNMEVSLVIASKRIIADHLRGLYYLIASGAPPPGKDGRARIVKMLIRKIITRLLILGIHPKEFLPMALGNLEIFTHKSMKHKGICKRIETYFLLETDRFFRTIEKGQRHIFRYLENNETKTLSKAQLLFFEKNLGLPYLLITLLLQNKLVMPNNRPSTLVK